MKLHQWLDGKDRRLFAARCSITLTALVNYMSGRRFPRPDVIARIERVTDSEVTVKDLFEVWRDAQRASDLLPVPMEKARRVAIREARRRRVLEGRA